MRMYKFAVDVDELSALIPDANQYSRPCSAPLERQDKCAAHSRQDRRPGIHQRHASEPMRDISSLNSAPAGALMRLVEEYESIGQHRTGDPCDAATIEWASDALSERGGRVSHYAYTFPKFRQRTEVVVDGDIIPSLALFYSATGRYSAEMPAVRPVKMDPSLDNGTMEVDSAGGLSLLATKGPTGLLYAPNRLIGPADGAPAILVSGTATETLMNGQVSAFFEADVVEGHSRNIVARFGPDRAPDVLLASTLSGWFAAAGDRGTGLALLLELARQLSEDMSLTVVLTTGHELGYVGAWNLAKLGVLDQPRVMMYLGSSLATLHASPSMSQFYWRNIAASVDKSGQQRLQELAEEFPLRELRLLGNQDPRERWMGEARVWSSFGVPAVSIAGVHPEFHTPDDLAARVTSEAELQRFFNLTGMVAETLLTPLVRAAR